MTPDPIDVTSRTDAPSPSVVLLVAHGSRNPLAAVEHERLCVEVQQRLDSRFPESTATERGDSTSAAEGGPVEVRPAYLEFVSPSALEALEQAVSDGATSISVLPYFLNSGNHVLVDLPAVVNDVNARHPEVDIILEAHVGSESALAGIVVERITHAV